MADPARDEQPVRVADTNNGPADKNGHLDNPGDPGHSAIPVTTAPGPSTYRDGVTASSSTTPPALEDDPVALAHRRAAQFYDDHGHQSTIPHTNAESQHGLAFQWA